MRTAQNLSAFVESWDKHRSTVPSLARVVQVIARASRAAIKSESACSLTVAIDRSLLFKMACKPDMALPLRDLTMFDDGPF